MDIKEFQVILLMKISQEWSFLSIHWNNSQKLRTLLSCQANLS